MNVISNDLVVGENFKIGVFNHIHEGVIIGDNCTIRDYVEIRSGTVIGDQCYIDSGVKISGKCFIGNGVTIRYDSIIARGCWIGDNVFISPQCMTENLDSNLESIGGVHIEHDCFVGSNVTFASGIRICPYVTIGSKSNVRKDIIEYGVYFGNPARKVK